jgi:hypothetical protein
VSGQRRCLWFESRKVDLAGRLSNLPPHLERVLNLVPELLARRLPASQPIRMRQAQTRLTAEIVEELVRDYEAGGRVADLVDLYGVCRETIYGHLQARGVVPSRKRPPSTPAEVAAVHERSAARDSILKIARALETSPATIRRQDRPTLPDLHSPRYAS